MAAKSTWRGAIEFAGFPINVSVYPLLKSRSGESFKMITPDGEPVEQFYRAVDKEDGQLYKVGELGRAIDLGDELRPIPAEALEQISEAERSTVVSAKYFAPVGTLPLELSIGAYAVVPDSKVAGAKASVNALWNYLRDSAVAYVTQATFRSGSKDVVLAIYANERGLVAATFPFVEDLHPAIESDFTTSTEAAKKLAKHVKKSEIKAFSLDDFESQFKARRQAAIDAAMDGKPLPTREVEEPKVNDLMAFLEAAA